MPSFNLWLHQLHSVVKRFNYSYFEQWTSVCDIFWSIQVTDHQNHIKNQPYKGKQNDRISVLAILDLLDHFVTVKCVRLISVALHGVPGVAPAISRLGPKNKTHIRTSPSRCNLSEVGSRSYPHCSYHRNLPWILTLNLNMTLNRFRCCWLQLVKFMNQTVSDRVFNV